MTYQTHAWLGDQLYPVLCETWNIQLSRKKLIKGSIEPDRSSLFVRHPHFWKHSHRYIEKQIRKIARMELRPGRKNKKFSRKLGIILHYVADFFTSAHNITPNRLKAHLNFEARLHEEFIAHIDTDTLRDTLALIGPDAFHGDGKQLLRDLHARYSPTGMDSAYDIRSIVIACLAVASWIIESATAAGDTAAGTGLHNLSDDAILNIR